MPPKRSRDSLARPPNPGRDTITGRRDVAQPAEASLAMPPKRSRDSLARPLIPGRDTINTSTGRSAAWLARLSGGQEVPGSNPGAPTLLQAGFGSGASFAGAQ